MAEEFQTGVCSGNWWNNMRTSSFDGSAVEGSSVSCSAGIDDMVSYGWTGTEIAESKTRSREDSSVSGSSVTFQDAHHKVPVTGGLLIDPCLPATAFGLSSPTVDWNHALLSNGRADHQNSFHAMLQEELSSKPYFHHDPAASIASNNQVHMGVVEDMNQAFILDQHHPGSGNGSGDTTVNSFPIVSASFGGGPSMFMQALFEPDLKPHQQSGYDHGSYHLSSNEMNQQNQPSWSKFPQLFKPSLPLPSPPKQQQQQQLVGQLHFANNTTFWNAPAATPVNEPRPGFFPPMHTQFFPHGFEAKHNSTSTTTKPISDGARELSSATKKGGNEPALKKPRVDTPSPLPTFKVRKEKLSDRITALQQMVSPFGKTDTASVLYEAIEYIKFLHGQVNFLSTPYLKNGHPMQHQQQNSVKSKDVEGPKQDLRSRGLCLVPISSTFPVANEPTADFWNATLGGSYR